MVQGTQTFVLIMFFSKCFLSDTFTNVSSRHDNTHTHTHTSQQTLLQGWVWNPLTNIIQTSFPQVFNILTAWTFEAGAVEPSIFAKPFTSAWASSGPSTETFLLGHVLNLSQNLQHVSQTLFWTSSRTFDFYTNLWSETFNFIAHPKIFGWNIHSTSNGTFARTLLLEPPTFTGTLLLELFD